MDMTIEKETNLEKLEDNEELETQQEQPESVADTIRAVMGDIKDEADKDLQGNQGEDGKQSLNEKSAKEDRESTKNKKRQTYEKKDLDVQTRKGKQEKQERLEAPNRFPIEKKEWFNKQPREVQEEVVKGWGEIEGHTTKVWQDLQREKNRYTGVNQVLDHYVTKWGVQGLTPDQAVTEFAATYDDIIQRGPAAFVTMIQKAGYTIDDIVDAAIGGQAPQQQQQNRQQIAPEIKGLTEKVDSLYNYFNQSQQSVQQRALQAAVSEVNAVKLETDANGTYLYPELHDASQVQRVQPLVEDLRKSQPSISWSEATKRAVQTLRVLDGKISPPSPNGQRLQNNDLTKLKNAGVSISSRGSGIAPSNGQPPSNESVADSLRAVFSAYQQRYN